jgi:hypothetical protein
MRPPKHIVFLALGVGALIGPLAMAQSSDAIVGNKIAAWRIPLLSLFLLIIKR